MENSFSYQPAADRYERMPYKYCGKSGLQLPLISLGLWHNFGSVDNFDVATDMIKYAFDHGVTHFDLANNYGPIPGSAEINFGRILRENFQGYRDEMIISSKAGHDMWAGPYGGNSSRKNLMASIDQSLRRTGLEYFDIFYSHRYDGVTPVEETIQTLIDIVKQGKSCRMVGPVGQGYQFIISISRIHRFLACRSNIHIVFTGCKTQYENNWQYIK